MTKKTKSKETEKIQNLEEKNKELLETLQRLQAEFENYKKRVETEQTDYVKYAGEDVIKSLLSVLDTFELAIKNKDNKEEFIKGVEMIYAQLFQSLEERGLKPIQAKGKKFNPYEHEALITEQSKEEENTVLEELQKGYTLNGKVIRHTKVKVSKK